MGTITLDEVYAEEGLPARNELFWEWVYKSELAIPYPIKMVNPVEYVKQTVPGLDKTYLEVFLTDSTSENKANVKSIRKLARNIASTTFMVVCDNQIIDGWHRMIAYALEGITQAQAVDISEES